MKTGKQKKAGFTLVELMVVAIIVAILAAVAIPLMSGNKDRAKATEGQAGCTTLATQLRMYYAENDSTAAGLADLDGIKAGDLDGTYFRQADYSFTHNDKNNYIIRAVSTTGETDSDGNVASVIMTVTPALGAQWTGTLLD